MTQLFRFSWQVPTGGFHLQRGSKTSSKKVGAKDVFLVARRAPPGAAEWRRYSLFQNDETGRDRTTGLFRTFADLNPASVEEIINFANKHGRLGHSGTPFGKSQSKTSNTLTFFKLDEAPDVPIDPAIRGEPPTKDTYAGESLDLWRTEIAFMRGLLELWLAVSSKPSTESNRQLLRKHVIWKDGAVSVQADGVPTHIWPHGSAWAVPGDLNAPVLEFLRIRVNEQIAKWDAVPRLGWDDKHESLRLFMWPETMIGALWLQFSNAIDGNRTYDQCAPCGRWFERGMEVKSNAKFCSNACRQKEQRRKEKEALDLKGQGFNVREIAARLGSDVHVVKGWLRS